MPWVRHGVGFTSQWKGFGGCLSGSLFCWGLGVILLLYSIVKWFCLHLDIVQLCVCML